MDVCERIIVVLPILLSVPEIIGSTSSVDRKPDTKTHTHMCTARGDHNRKDLMCDCWCIYGGKHTVDIRWVGVFGHDTTAAASSRAADNRY